LTASRVDQDELCAGIDEISVVRQHDRILEELTRERLFHLVRGRVRQEFAHRNRKRAVQQRRDLIVTEHHPVEVRGRGFG